MPLYNPSSNSSTGSNNRGLYTIPDMPALSTFGQVNISGTASAIENSGKAITIVDTEPTFQSIHLNGLTKVIPAATPYRISILALLNAQNVGYWGFAFGWTDGIKFDICSQQGGETFCHPLFSDANTRVSAGDNVCALPMMQGALWLGLRDDGSNIYFEFSLDGANYTTIVTSTKAAGYLSTNGYTSIFFGLFNGNYTYPTPSGNALSASFLAYDENGLTRFAG